MTRTSARVLRDPLRLPGSSSFAFRCASLAALALPAGAQTPIELAELVAGDTVAGDYFGVSVDVAGDLLVAGALGHDAVGHLAGAAYVFEFAGGAWQETAKLLPPDPVPGLFFGRAAACTGDTIVVSTPSGNGVAGLSGAAYVFVRSGGGWVHQQKLWAADGETGDDYGFAVALDGDTAVIGAHADDDLNDNQGSVYVYLRSGGVWSLEQKLVAPVPGPQHHFGFSVAIDGDTIGVGAPGDDPAGFGSGSAYVFTRNAGTWSMEQQLVVSGGQANDGVGTSVAIHGDRVLVGAIGASGAVPVTGAAYLFERSGSSWSERAKLVPDDAQTSDQVGWSVALAGDRVVVAAPNQDAAGTDAGALYTFAEAAGGWQVEAKLVAGTAGAFDAMGTAVAADGAWIVAGSQIHDGVDAGTGAAFVFGSLPVGQSFCQSLPNSTGQPASISGHGSPSVAINHVELFAEPVPAGELGLFYYGPNQIQVPFGNGFQCVGSGTVGLARLGIVLADAGGRMSWLLDNTAPPIPQATILPGSTWNFQAWFHDSAGGGSFFDLSDGLEVTFSN